MFPHRFEPGRSRRASFAGLLLLGGGLSVLLPGLSSIEVVFRTDARYLEAAREIFEAGSWGVPTLAGVPHLTKPPLAYWAGAAGYALFGVGPFGGRCASALAVLGTALLLYRFARRSLPAEAALVAGAIPVSSLLPFGVAHALSTDALLTLAVTGALLALADAVERRRADRGVVTAAAWLGLAVLAKGPIGPLLVGASWAAYRLTGGPGLGLRRSTRASALVALAAIAAPWFLWIEWRFPGTLRWMVGYEFLGRLDSGGPGHPAPWYALLLYWLGGAFPFSLLLLVVLVRGGPGRTHPGDRPGWHLLWIASWLPVLLLSLPSGKLPTYVLPALPPAALVLARATASGSLGSRPARWALGLGFFGVAALAGLLLAGLAAPGHLAERLRAADPSALGRGPLFLGGAFGIGALSLGAGWRALRRSPDARAVLLLAGLSAGALVLGVLGVGPALRGHREGAELARSIRGVQVVHFGTFLPSFLFYFGDVDRTRIAAYRPLGPPHIPTPRRVRLSAEEGLATMADPQPTLLLAKVGRVGELVERTAGEVVWCGRKHCLIANPPAAAQLHRSPQPAETQPGVGRGPALRGSGGGPSSGAEAGDV